jgi:CHASE2 domain-containing sensor protein
MRFSDQVRWSRKWGATLLLFSIGVLGLLVLLRATVDRDALMLWANVVTLCLFVAVVMLVFGGLMRPLQKKMYHSVFEASEHYRARLAVNPIIRWFWWLDSEGRDRDA